MWVGWDTQRNTNLLQQGWRRDGAPLLLIEKDLPLDSSNRASVLRIPVSTWKGNRLRHWKPWPSAQDTHPRFCPRGVYNRYMLASRGVPSTGRNGQKHRSLQVWKEKLMLGKTEFIINRRHLPLIALRSTYDLALLQLPVLQEKALSQFLVWSCYPGRLLRHQRFW